MKDLTLADIEQRIDDVDPAPLIRGAVPVSDISRARGLKLRRAIEAERGAAYTDSEWAEAKANLVAFFGLLAELDLKYSKGEHR